LAYDEGFAPGNEQEDEGHLTPEDQDDSTDSAPGIEQDDEGSRATKKN
jgi:hypothetical protein